MTAPGVPIETSGPATSSFSGLYTVNNYREIYNNYIMRGGVVPYSNKVAYIKFLTRFYIAHGYLRGLLEKIGALMAQPLHVRAKNAELTKRCEAFAKKLNYRTRESQSVVAQLLYDYAVLMYFPKQDIMVKCPQCGKVTKIDRSYSYPFRIIPIPDGVNEYSTVRADYRIPWAERRLYDQPLGIRVVCENCGSEFLQEPTTQWDFKTPGSLHVMNPHLVNVYVNDAGKKFVTIDSRFYEGALMINTDLEYFNIEGLTWDLIKVYASRAKIYLPHTDFYSVFCFNDMAGIGSGGGSVSPTLSAVNELVSVDVLRMGNEGIAFSKLDPLYIISPTDVSGQGALELIDRRQVRDFIVEGIKAHAEGDISRAMWSPIPVNAQPLYGDGKRFLNLNELMAFQAGIPAVYGFSPDAFQGGSGILFNDPFNLTMLTNLYDRFREDFLTLLDNIFMRSVDGYRTAKLKGEVTLELENISIMKGGLKFDEWLKLLDGGAITMDELLEYLGKPGMSYWLERRNDAAMVEAKFDADLDERKQQFAKDQKAKADQSVTEAGTPNRALAEQQIIEEAQQHVQAMTQFGNDQGQVNSYLEALGKQSPVLAAVVADQWKTYKNQLRQQNDPANQAMGGDASLQQGG